MPVQEVLPERSELRWCADARCVRRIDGVERPLQEDPKRGGVLMPGVQGRRRRRSILKG
jgi:hypothetical protein